MSATTGRCAAAAVALLVLLGCEGPGPSRETMQKLHTQERFEPYAPSEFFADGRAMREPPANIIARGRLKANRPVDEGIDDYGVIRWMPVEETEELLARGAERYGIFCATCHGQAADGAGPVSEHNREIPSLVDPPISELGVGETFRVLAGKIRPSPAHAHYVAPADNWAIIAHIRDLRARKKAAGQ